MTRTAHDVETDLREILDEQYADGERRQNQEGSVWGGTGGDVKRAVMYARDAIREPQADETAMDYRAAMTAAIEAERAHYREIEDDKDGYGNGTFVEILRAAGAIRV